MFGPKAALVEPFVIQTLLFSFLVILHFALAFPFAPLVFVVVTFPPATSYEVTRTFTFTSMHLVSLENMYGSMRSGCGDNRIQWPKLK